MWTKFDVQLYIYAGERMLKVNENDGREIEMTMNVRIKANGGRINHVNPSMRLHPKPGGEIA